MCANVCEMMEPNVNTIDVFLNVGLGRYFTGFCVLFVILFDIYTVW